METPPGEPLPPEPPPPAHSTGPGAVGTAGGSAGPHIPLTHGEGDGLGCVGADSQPLVDATRVLRVGSSSGDSSSSSIPETESGQKKPGEELTIDLGGGGRRKAPKTKEKETDATPHNEALI